MNIKLIYIAFFKYLQHPYDEKSIITSNIQKLKTCSYLYLLNMIAIVVLVCFLRLLESFHFLEPTQHHVEEQLFSKSILLSFLLVGIIGPVIEELIFRLPLRYQYNYIFKAIFHLVADLGRFTPEQEERIIANFRQKYFAWFFYPMAIIFGCLHITNYQGYKEILYWIPLLTSIQFIAGLFLGYIRVQFGLIWSIFFHSFNNFLFLAIALCSIHSFKGVQTSTDHYFVSIRPTAASSANNLFADIRRITPDTISFRNIQVNNIICMLSQTSSKYIKSNSMMPVDIDFYMKQPQHNSTYASLALLNEIKKAFHIHFIRKQKSVDASEIYVCDTSKFNRYQRHNKCEADYYSLKSFSTSIDRLYPEYYITCSDTLHKFTFNFIPGETFNHLKIRLSGQYGIRFRDTKKICTFILVEKE